MTYEIELKLRFEPQQADLLCQALDQLAGSSQQFTLNNSYYDTPDARLSRAACALRIRQKGDSFEQTLKTRGDSQGGLTRRREWNWPLASAQLDEQLLGSDEVQACWPQDVAVADLIPLFATNFERRRWLWQQGDNRVELVMDRGAVLAAEQQQPLCELELELLQGDAACLWPLAQSLCQRLPLWLSDISKAERGFALVGMGRAWQPKADALLADACDSAELLTALQHNFEHLKRALEQSLWLEQPAVAQAAVPETTQEAAVNDATDSLALAALKLLPLSQRLQIQLASDGAVSLTKLGQALVSELLVIALTVRSAASSAAVSDTMAKNGAEKLLQWGELLFNLHTQPAESAAPGLTAAAPTLDPALDQLVQQLAALTLAQNPLDSSAVTDADTEADTDRLPWSSIQQWYVGIQAANTP